MGIYQACTVHDIMRLGLHALCCLAAQARAWARNDQAIVFGMINHMQIVRGVNPSSCRGGAEYTHTHTQLTCILYKTHFHLSPHTHECIAGNFHKLSFSCTRSVCSLFRTKLLMYIAVHWNMQSKKMLLFHKQQCNKIYAQFYHR